MTQLKMTQLKKTAIAIAAAQIALLAGAAQAQSADPARSLLPYSLLTDWALEALKISWVMITVILLLCIEWLTRKLLRLA